ncbi:uncharacterized protein LOC114551472 [Perca flavescens]|uniref:uncharacterized protein LOC114551472 n=1 Tax=Perca flavescens TaxID=8167 RepID=UPI00106ED669|nr:uncharacterized protein LOC114551472 [Perca flavescens]
MDLRWMILPVFLVFLVFVEAENLTVVKAKLGQNTVFTCSGDIKDTYWYIEIRSQVKGLIAQTFSMDPSDTWYDIHTTLKTKYVAKGNVFEITNITAEDCRLYFCARKEGGNIIFKDTFLLISDEPITPSTNNSSEGNDLQQQNSCILCQSEVIYSSLALNILFILVIIGLVLTLLCLKRKKCNHQGTDPSSFTYENLQRKKCNRQGTDPSSFTYENLQRKKCNRQGTDPSSFTYKNQQRKKCNRQGTDPSSFTYKNQQVNKLLLSILKKCNRQGTDPSSFTYKNQQRKKCNRQGTDPSSFTYKNQQRKKCNRQGTNPSSCIYENPETMEMPKYKEIQLRKFPPAVASSETIYCWPQLPPNPRKKEKDKNKQTSG